MNLRKLIFTQNECYKAGKKITVKGLMLHSTGANNPNLKRYVGPDDGLLGKNAYNNHWNQARPGGRQVCVHGFIGKLADGSIATYQTLPWNHRGWHAGGKANDTHIGVEICEDSTNDKVYFDKVYQEATELFAYLCKEFNLNPLTAIIDHSEGRKLGLASNHADVSHWFPKHGKSMNTFRNDVKKLMEAEVEKYILLVDVPVYTSSAKAKAEKNSTRNYKAGEYFIYNKANGMINITKTSGSPGGWINPKDNVKETPKEETKEPELEENKEKTLEEEVKEVIEKPIEETIKDTIITENEFDEIMESDILKTDKNIFIILLEKLIELITNIFKK